MILQCFLKYTMNDQKMRQENNVPNQSMRALCLCFTYFFLSFCWFFS